ncbi:MAG: DUF1223 domain-containing protein [Alphaproteobacteria bacterium]|nr:DUF1223 domain-containing protein [Alphaproteobacteria bacterium]
MHRMALLVAILLAPLSAAAAEPPHRPVVVELFTSQGCSSCPPADAFLAELARDRTDVLPLGFHITYWNRLGWHDPFSLDAATARHRHYAALFGMGGVYTPQMVVDGKRDVVGSDRAAALSAIRAAAARVSTGPTLHLAREAGSITLDAGAGQGRATLWLIGYDREHSTAIGRGENSGHTLLEANIVRDIVDAGAWTGAPLHVSLPLPRGERVAAILQAEDGSVIGAATVVDQPTG